MDQHVDAVVTGAIALLGATFVHLMTVGRMQANIREIKEDVKELKRDTRNVSRRFHFLNNFSMVLHASVKKIAGSLGVDMHEVKGYDFEGEDEPSESR